MNQQIEEIIAEIVLSQKNIDIWEEYETNIICCFNHCNFYRIIENYNPCGYQNLYVSKYQMAGTLYKNIKLNDNLFFELFKNGRYPRKECDFTYNDVWNLIEECANILVQKQIDKKAMK